MASDQTTTPIDPPPEYLRQGRTDEAPVEPVVDPGRMRRIGLVVVASAIVVASASGMWIAYEQGVRKGVQMAPPLIQANTSPIKIAPTDRGGQNFPHQDKTVYDRLNGKPETVEAERLLPPPEVIVKKPAPVVEEPVIEESVTKLNASNEPKPAATSDVTQSNSVIPLPLKPIAAPVEKVDPKPEPVAKVAPAKVVKKAVAKPKAAPAKTKPVVLIKPGSHLIQVGAYRTASKATAGWARLVKSNKALLGRLKPIVVRADLGSRGVFHRLRAGPVDGAEAAKALCSRLKQRKVGCLVIKP